MKGTALAWWKKYNVTNFNPLHTWDFNPLHTWDLKQEMTRYSVPADYKQQLYVQFTQMVQGSMSVEEFTRKF